MSAPTVTRMIGVNTLDGLGHIVPLNLTCDMGDNGRIAAPITLDLGRAQVKLSWVNKYNGNMIYREIDPNE